MPSGRSSADRGRNRRQVQGTAARRPERARGGKAAPKENGTKRAAAGTKRVAPGAKRPVGNKTVRKRSGDGTGGAFKLSSTRRASVLALVVCTMALSVSVPLRTYLSQRDELAAQERKQAQLAEQVEELEQRKTKLADPDHVEAEARARLGLVRPGETPYIVQVPSDESATQQQTEQQIDDIPWYEDLWKSLTGKGT
ncbi:FtsB family cell division protein [Parasphingorhabdus pacifica]